MDNELLQAISDMMDTKLDFVIAKMATKEDLQSIRIELYDEIIRAEKAVDVNGEMLKSLNEKYDTLLLKADNTDLLLRLINRQADELDSLKARIEMLEKKIS